MSEERDINLGRIIKESDFNDKKEEIAKKLKENPYSQPLHRLANKLNLDNNLPLHQYAWLDKSTDTDEDNKVMTLSNISLKSTKTKDSSESSQATDSTQLATTTKPSLAPVQEVKKEDTSQPRPNKAITQGSSSFTQWLNKNAKPLSITNDLSDYLPQESEPIVKNKISQPSNLPEKVIKKESTPLEDLETIKDDNTTKSALKKKKKKSKLQKKIDASLQDHKNIASEPLAKLYKKQGFYKKSLRMYEQLSLINPEKSGFFAPLIEELKNKLK